LGVCDISRVAAMDWRLRRWRLWFLALSNAPRHLFRNPCRQGKSPLPADFSEHFPKSFFSNHSELFDVTKRAMRRSTCATLLDNQSYSVA